MNDLNAMLLGIILFLFFLIVIPLLLISVIRIGRGIWICPKCSRKNIESICRKCEFDRRTVPRKHIQVINQWETSTSFFILIVWFFWGELLFEIISFVLNNIIGLQQEIGIIVGNLFFYALAFALTVYIVSFRYRKSLEDIGIRFDNRKLTLLGGIGIAAAASITELIYESIIVLIPLQEYLEKFEIEQLSEISNPWFFYPFVLIVVPFVEELVFRGLIHRGFRQRWNIRKAVIFGALIFALLHPLSDFIPIFLMGVMLAWFYEKTNNLTGCILAHSLNNLMVVLIPMLSKN